MPDLEAKKSTIKHASSSNGIVAIFCRKVGGWSYPDQLRSISAMEFACILQQLAPHITFHEHEALQVELETGINVDDSSREIDLMFPASDQAENTRSLSK